MQMGISSAVMVCLATFICRGITFAAAGRSTLELDKEILAETLEDNDHVVQTSSNSSMVDVSSHRHGIATRAPLVSKGKLLSKLNAMTDEHGDNIAEVAASVLNAAGGENAWAVSALVKGVLAAILENAAADESKTLVGTVKTTFNIIVDTVQAHLVFQFEACQPGDLTRFVDCAGNVVTAVMNFAASNDLMAPVMSIIREIGVTLGEIDDRTGMTSVDAWKFVFLIIRLVSFVCLGAAPGYVVDAALVIAEPALERAFSQISATIHGVMRAFTKDAELRGIAEEYQAGMPFWVDRTDWKPLGKVCTQRVFKLASAGVTPKKLDETPGGEVQYFYLQEPVPMSDLEKPIKDAKWRSEHPSVAFDVFLMQAAAYVRIGGKLWVATEAAVLANRYRHLYFGGIFPRGQDEGTCIAGEHVKSLQNPTAEQESMRHDWACDMAKRVCGNEQSDHCAGESKRAVIDAAWSLTFKKAWCTLPD